MGQELFSNEEARGGSAWGAGTLANGDGSRQPSKIELDFAEYQVATCHQFSVAMMLVPVCIGKMPDQSGSSLLCTVLVRASLCERLRLRATEHVSEIFQELDVEHLSSGSRAL